MFRISFRILCESALSGNILQLNLVTYYPRECVSQNGDMCKIQLQKQLKNMFRRMLIISVMIQFDDNRSKGIDIEICSLTEMTGKIKSSIRKESHYHLLRRRRKNSYNNNKKKTSKNTTGTSRNGTKNCRKQ